MEETHPVNQQVEVQTLQSPEHEKKNLLNSKWIILGLIVLTLTLVAAFTGYLYLSQNKQVACTLEAKICPDGSSVGRSGPNCKFSECPSISPVFDSTEGWDTYISSRSGYFFKYPIVDWKLEDFGSYQVIQSKDWTSEDGGLAYDGSIMTVGARETDFTSIDKEINKPRGGFPYINIKKVIVDGADAREYETGAEHILLATQFIKEGFLYTITLNSTNEDDYRRDSSIYRHLISTFKFTQ